MVNAVNLSSIAAFKGIDERAEGGLVAAGELDRGGEAIIGPAGEEDHR